MFQYRISYETKMVGSDGKTDWIDYDGFGTTEEEVRADLSAGGTVSLELETAINDSGFGYSVEVREVADGEES